MLTLHNEITKLLVLIQPLSLLYCFNYYCLPFFLKAHPGNLATLFLRHLFSRNSPKAIHKLSLANSLMHEENQKLPVLCTNDH